MIMNVLKGKKMMKFEVVEDVESDDRIEDLFSEECCKMLWEMEFVG